MRSDAYPVDETYSQFQVIIESQVGVATKKQLSLFYCMLLYFLFRIN